MRLYVSGIAPDVSRDDVHKCFASLGIVHVHTPPPRVLGDEVLPRGFVHVEVVDADEARTRRLMQALNGSTWKGRKLHVAPAAPDYNERLAAEAAADAYEQQDGAEADGSNDAPDPITIKLPSGTPFTLVPGAVTGCQKRFFRPVPPAPLCEWLSVEPHAAPPPGSALYHVNDLWDSALESRMRAEPLDSAMFEAAQARSAPTQAAPSQPRPRWASLLEDDGTENAVAIMDDERPRAPAKAQGARAYHSDSDSEEGSHQGGFVVPMAQPAARGSRMATAAPLAADDELATLGAGIDDDDVPIDSLAAGGDMLDAAGGTALEDPSETDGDVLDAAGGGATQHDPETDGDLLHGAANGSAGNVTEAAEALFARMAGLLHSEDAHGTSSASSVPDDGGDATDDGAGTTSSNGASDGADDLADAPLARSPSQHRSEAAEEEPTERRVAKRERTRLSAGTGDTREPRANRQRVLDVADSTSGGSSGGEAAAASEPAQQESSTPVRGMAGTNPQSPAAQIEREAAPSDWERALALAAGGDSGDPAADAAPVQPDAQEPPEGAVEWTRDAEPATQGGSIEVEMEALQREVAAARAGAKKVRKPRARQDRAQQRAAARAQPVRDKGAAEHDEARQGGETLAGLFKAGGGRQGPAQPLATSPRDREAPSGRDAAQDRATAALFADVPFARPSADSAPESCVSGKPTSAPLATPAVPTAGLDLSTMSAQAMIARLREVMPSPPREEQVGRPSDTFVRSEDLAVLESKLKAARPALIADFRSKQRTVLRKAKDLAKNSKKP